MAVLIKPEKFDPAAEQSAYETRLKKGSFGATASFIGTMRSFNEGDWFGLRTEQPHSMRVDF